MARKRIDCILREAGLGHLAARFAEEAIEDDLLADLTDADLIALGVTQLGHRKRLLRAFVQAAPPAAPEGDVIARWEAAVERGTLDPALSEAAMREAGESWIAQLAEAAAIVFFGPFNQHTDAPESMEEFLGISAGEMVDALNQGISEAAEGLQGMFAALAEDAPASRDPAAWAAVEDQVAVHWQLAVDDDAGWNARLARYEHARAQLQARFELEDGFFVGFAVAGARMGLGDLAGGAMQAKGLFERVFRKDPATRQAYDRWVETAQDLVLCVDDWREQVFGHALNAYRLILEAMLQDMVQEPISEQVEFVQGLRGEGE